MQPYGARLLVKPDAVIEKTEAGVIIPSQAQTVKGTGTVIAVGTGIRLQDGTVKPLDFQPEDRVMFVPGAGRKIEGKDLIMLEESHVLATL